MSENKYYVIGSGIVGAVIAHELAVRGNEVGVWERREHTGGNVYDLIDEHGIHVHLYGPHIFHTKIERVWKYVSKHCKLNDYNLVCGSVIDGKCVPTSFDYTSIDVFFPQEAAIIKKHINDVFGVRKSATILEMLNCDDLYVKKYAQFLYDKDYAPYTAKQWGIEASEVDKEIFKRVPVLFSYGSKYFDDSHQAIPERGYMEFINNLLSNKLINVQTRKEAMEHLCIKDKSIYIDGKNADGIVIYTGPIDELFGCIYGRLPYRSLRFEWKYEEINSFQDMPVVAYPQADGYTRITEYKKLPYQDVKGTTYAIEYPLPYNSGEQHEPYYPVLTEKSNALFARYEALAKDVEGLICCGRLADFKYYNMDTAIERALNVVEEILGEEVDV